jgi:hypothetical protein
MARCSYCKAETNTHECGVAICVACAAARDADPTPSVSAQKIRIALVGEIVDATARVNIATEAFNAVMNHSPSADQPNGAHRIHNASRELSAAREEMMKAHTRLNDFVDRDIVPVLKAKPTQI